jgi:YD repeat-containing protein
MLGPFTEIQAGRGFSGSGVGCRGVGQATSIEYSAGSHYSYPTSITNAKGHSTGLTHNSRGQLLTATDANGAVTSRTYDSLGRPTRIDYPGGGYVRFEYIRP